MTDKEIEQALQKRAYDIDYDDNGNRWIIPKDNLSQETLAYIDRLKAENAELKEDIDERDFILDIFNQREYRKKFIKEVWEGEMGEKLSTPDADFIYKLYFEERAKNEYLQAEITQIKHNWEIGKNVQRTKIRKKTANDILRTLYRYVIQGAHDSDDSFAFACNQMKTKILVEAKKYRVEVGK